jgi:hypothetical protein
MFLLLQIGNFFNSFIKEELKKDEREIQRLKESRRRLKN